MNEKKKYIKCRIHGFNLNSEIDNLLNEIINYQNKDTVVDSDLINDIAIRAKKKFLHSIYNDYKDKFECKDEKLNELDVGKDILKEKLKQIIIDEMKCHENKNEHNNNIQNIVTSGNKTISIKNDANLLENFFKFKRSFPYDFIIQLDTDTNQVFECHKLLFAFKSNYFYKLFENRQNINQVYFTNINKTSFDFIYNYIYGTKIKFNPFNFVNLFISVEILEIEELKITLEKFHQENLNNLLFKKINRSFFLNQMIIKCQKRLETNVVENLIKIHICNQECIKIL
jgi:hypothetical protein